MILPLRKKNIYLYSDDGAGDFSLFCARSYFKDHNISCVTAAQIIEEGMPESVDIFIMPGGADRPYARKLNGKGNDIIRRYVENGGTYLGICAGAYYGCTHIEFQKNTANEICEKRELGFFKGTAIGCLKDIAPLYDQTLKSASVTRITQGEQNYPVFYWGECYFAASRESDFKIIAHYNDVTGRPPAIISCPVGKGKAILSGVHFEASDNALTVYDFSPKEENRLKLILSKSLPKEIFNIKDYL